MLRDFIGFLNKYTDVARTNRFHVEIIPPPLVANQQNSAGNQPLQIGVRPISEILRYTCEVAELPGRNLEVFERRTYGVVEKMPVQTQYSEITLTFILMANSVSGDGSRGIRGFSQEYSGLATKRFFEDWMQHIHSNPNGPSITGDEPSYLLNYKSEYATRIHIKHFDSLEKTRDSSLQTYSVTLVDAYPIVLGSVGLNWSDDSPLRFPVTFAYTNWYRGYGGPEKPMATGIIS